MFISLLKVFSLISPIYNYKKEIIVYQHTSVFVSYFLLFIKRENSKCTILVENGSKVMPAFYDRESKLATSRIIKERFLKD